MFSLYGCQPQNRIILENILLQLPFLFIFCLSPPFPLEYKLKMVQVFAHFVHKRIPCTKNRIWHTAGILYIFDKLSNVFFWKGRRKSRGKMVLFAEIKWKIDLSEVFQIHGLNTYESLETLKYIVEALTHKTLSHLYWG